MNENDKIMTQYLTKNFVDHRNVSLAKQAVAELSLHHGERGFNVRPLMVVLQKLFPFELEVVKRLVPNATPVVASRVRFESDKRLGSDGLDSFKVRARGIPFVGRDFGDLKVLRRGVNESGKQRGIVRVSAMNFIRGIIFCFHAAQNF